MRVCSVDCYRQIKKIVESDSKLYVDAIGLDKATCDWNISTLCLDAIGLASQFSSCNFCWVKR